MAETNPEVMAMIKDELQKNPDISNQELFEKAQSVDPDIAKLSARQFNARYPLQVKRTVAPKKKTTTRRTARGRTRGETRTAAARRAPATPRLSKAPTDSRDKVRAVLLELARDVAAAEGKGDVVDVIMSIDRYVDRVVKAAG